jgi:23S rRNA pseudouridine1911/1915/1917 synthase
LKHPKTGEILHLESPLPEDLLLLESRLKAAL